MKAAFSGKYFSYSFMRLELPYIYSGMKFHCPHQVAVNIFPSTANSLKLRLFRCTTEAG